MRTEHALPLRPPAGTVRGRRLALLLSLALHAGLVAALVLMPPPEAVPPSLPQTIEVALLPPEILPKAEARVEQPPAPPPARPVEPPAAKPIEPPPRPAPVTRAAPRPPKPAPPAVVPREQPPAVAEAAPAAVEPVAEAPRAVAETPVVPQAQATPVAPVAAPVAIAEPDPDPAALARYGDVLSSLFARSQTYPRMAAARGWEGEVLLQLTIARKGSLLAVRVLRSSGFEVLDRHALHLVEESAPLPAPPATLSGAELEVTVPVRYRLRAG